MVQPVAFELVFPFVNQMILEIGVVDDPERVGFYSGLIESMFSFMSFLAVMPCSYLSDHYGRKPVILLGTAGVAISTPLFGLSRTFWFMVVTRCLGGTSGGSWSATKIMLAEMTDKTNQGRAFSGLSVSYRLGQLIGQPLGGYLSHPERRWSWFQSPFWYDYPYSLPCFVAGAFAITAVIFGYFFIQETLASKRSKRPSKTVNFGTTTPPENGETSASVSDITNVEEYTRPPLRSVLTANVISLLLSTFAMVLQSEMLFALYPLFAFTPVHSGGLGVNEATIGAHMAIRSVINIALMVSYEPFQRRLGTVRLYQTNMAIWPISVALMPTLNYLARVGLQSSWLFDVVLVTFFTVWSFASLTWTGCGIMVNDSAPSAAALAAINGVSQMTIVLPQAIAPAFVTSLFAYSIKSGIAHGHLIWIFTLAFSTTAAIHSMTLKEPSHDWRQDLKNHSD
ncbi:MFS general substrate transporter [Rickenella mellea]|uniref:MFS general substrate transporter n=1 Tax=Rickenella mellea TaxID=50990 RepID=A0A4Y7Q3B7_9AGAM|nr:MFS general substrate transporter [Rickenella mellea]